MILVWIGIAVVFLSTITGILLQKFRPAQGKRQTWRGIIIIAGWGIGIAMISFGTGHYFAAAASIIVAAGISVFVLRSIGKMTEGMSPEEADETIKMSQKSCSDSIFAGCDLAEKRDDGYHYEFTVIWTSGSDYEQYANYRHGTMHMVSQEDYLIQGRVYYLDTNALAAMGHFKEECLSEGGLDISGINPGAFTDGGTVGATVMNLALRAYEGPQTDAEERTIKNIRNGKTVFMGLSFILVSIFALIFSLVNNITMDDAFSRAEEISKKSSDSIRAQVISKEACDDPDYTRLKLDYSYNGEKYESSFDVSTEHLYAYGDTVYVTVKNDNPARITGISTNGNTPLKKYNLMRNMGKIFGFVICGIFFVVGISLAVKGFKAKTRVS